MYNTYTTRSLLFLSFVLAFHTAWTQPYDILIKGGRVLDPKNHIDAVMDVAVSNGKIVRVAPSIDGQAAQVVNATGLYVTPGLIDMHVHAFYGPEPAYSNGREGIIPDGFTFRTGVTTVADAGSSGWKNFPLFKQQIIDHSLTRVLAWVNIVGGGMRGGNYEQDTTDMDGEKAAELARQYPDIVVGFKVAHYVGHSWKPVDEAVKGGTSIGRPVMIDFGSSKPPLSIQELFMQHLRPGDVFTHCFGQLRDREFIVDTLTQSVKPFVWEARRRGIIFDVGYGSISLAFSQAMAACRQGFYPSSISTDMHVSNVNASAKDLLNVGSQLLAMKMPLDSVIAAMSWNPARELRHEELGHLSEGAGADIALLNLRKGKFGFFDYTGRRIEGAVRLECAMTIRGGKIVYDLNGIARPVVLPRVVRRLGVI
ncbi:MAG TPA: amidohydrolase/deacetylase family metallohydrolase [Puia sp.]|nr:amidohydrolase/deacetylase family metallohydrolase [Puia sp.]